MKVAFGGSDKAPVPVHVWFEDSDIRPEGTTPPFVHLGAGLNSVVGAAYIEKQRELSEATALARRYNTLDAHDDAKEMGEVLDTWGKFIAELRQELFVNPRTHLERDRAALLYYMVRTGIGALATQQGADPNLRKDLWARVAFVAPPE